jgi:hypothetical protein
MLEDGVEIMRAYLVFSSRARAASWAGTPTTGWSAATSCATPLPSPAAPLTAH